MTDKKVVSLYKNSFDGKQTFMDYYFDAKEVP